MTDIVDKPTRSRMMSGIRGKNTNPEVLVRRHLFAAGLRFRLHRRDLPGVPDLVLPKYNVAIQVRGCFWHQHSGCKFAYMPKSNEVFWKNKLRGNTERDRRNDAALRAAGWHVLVVWECEISRAHLDLLVEDIKLAAKGTTNSAHEPRRMAS